MGESMNRSTREYPGSTDEYCVFGARRTSIRRSTPEYLRSTDEYSLYAGTPLLSWRFGSAPFPGSVVLNA
jgi:hypothetical protein